MTRKFFFPDLIFARAAMHTVLKMGTRSILMLEREMGALRAKCSTMLRGSMARKTIYCSAMLLLLLLTFTMVTTAVKTNASEHGEDGEGGTCSGRGSVGDGGSSSATAADGGSGGMNHSAWTPGQHVVIRKHMIDPDGCIMPKCSTGIVVKSHVLVEGYVRIRLDNRSGSVDVPSSILAHVGAAAGGMDHSAGDAAGGMQAERDTAGAAAGATAGAAAGARQRFSSGLEPPRGMQRLASRVSLG